MCGEQTKSSPDLFLHNLRVPMPLDEKLRLLRRNVWIRISKRQLCCGHPGEPGC